MAVVQREFVQKLLGWAVFQRHMGISLLYLQS